MKTQSKIVITKQIIDMLLKLPVVILITKKYPQANKKLLNSRFLIILETK